MSDPVVAVQPITSPSMRDSEAQDSELGIDPSRIGPCAHLGCESCAAGTCILEEDVKKVRDDEASSEEEVVRLARLLDSLQEKLNSIQVQHNTTMRNTQREIITLDLQSGAVEGMLREVEKVRDVVVEKATKAYDNRERLRRELGQSQVELVGRFGARRYRMMKREERIEDKWAGVGEDTDASNKTTRGRQEGGSNNGESTPPSRSMTDGDHRTSLASAVTSTSSAAVNRVSKTHSVASSQQRVGGGGGGGSNAPAPKRRTSRRKSKLTDAVSQYLEKKPSKRGSSGGRQAPANTLGEDQALRDAGAAQPQQSSSAEDGRRAHPQEMQGGLTTTAHLDQVDTVETVVQSLDRQSMADRGDAVLDWYNQKHQQQTPARVVEEKKESPLALPILVPAPPPSSPKSVIENPSRLMQSRHVEAAKRSISNKAAQLRPTERGVAHSVTILPTSQKL